MRPAHDFGVVVGLDLVEPLVRGRVLAEVLEAAASARAARHLPARAAARAEPLAHEVAVELLRVDVDAPALAVDDDAHVVRLRRRDVAARDLRVEHRAQERRVVVGVEQVEASGSRRGPACRARSRARG